MQKSPNGYKRLYSVGGLYICLTSGQLRLLEKTEVPYTLKNTSKPSKSLVITFLVLNTHLRVVVLG